MKLWRTIAMAAGFALLLAGVSWGQDKAKDTTATTPSSCEGRVRPAVKLTPAQTRSAIVERTDLPVPSGARVQGCVVLDVFISETGTVECMAPLHGLPILLQSVMPEVEKWKFKAVGKRRDGTMQLCWHNGWEVGNEFSQK